ncbi:MAG: hypothetical protein HY812_12460 [Planctomycetes bacterium]|nr:hypothetical protein [Planctomycetota bacterium]
MDYVLLCDLPPSVDSLRQRIGRGGRRSLGDQRAGYVVETAGEDVAFRVLFRLAREGKLCREPYAFRPSVLVQQALVLGGAESHVSASRLSEVVPAEIERLLPAGWAAEILEAMADKGLVEQAGAGRYVLSEAMDRAYRIGKLHGNLDPEGDVPVIDRATGDLVGHVARGEQRGDRIQLGGSGREVVAVTADGVMTDAVAQGGPAHFAPRGHPAVSFALAREIARELGAAPNEIVQRAAGEGFVLLHGLGSAGAPLLRYLLRGMPDPPRILAHSPVSMILDRALEWLPGVDSSTVDAFVQRAGARMRGFLALGPWHGCLPREFKRSTMRRVSGVDQAAEFLSAAVLKIEMETPAPPAWIA